MTDITPLIRPGSNVIQAYANDSVRISGAVYTSPVCVTVTSITPWSGHIPDTSFGDHDQNVELILIGLARVDGPLPENIRNSFRARGIAVDIMNIGAACRTYNVLMADGRRVGLALQIGATALSIPKLQ